LVDLGSDEHGATRLLARLRLASTPCLGSIVAPVLGDEGSRQLLVRGAFEVVQRPVGRDALVAAAERVVRGTVQLRTNVCVRPKMPPHAGPLESPGRRAKFELRGAVSALSLQAKLTPRETGVLRFIAMGYRYAEIADELSITVRTVKMHAANVRKKSGAKDRYALLRMLLERGA
jgi:DNA-binding NarL/FixJ family response regulator